MTNDDVFSLNMFGELDAPVDYTEMEDTPPPVKQPQEEAERWCGGRGGHDVFVERLGD